VGLGTNTLFQKYLSGKVMGLPLQQQSLPLDPSLMDFNPTYSTISYFFDYSFKFNPIDIFVF
jgi:hypothetical protein